MIIEAKPVVCSSFSLFTVLLPYRKDRDLRVCSLDSGCERCEDILDHLSPVNFHPIFGAFTLLMAPN